MSNDEFIKYIESIGFKYNYGLYEYKGFRIYLFSFYYSFFNDLKKIQMVESYNELRPLENNFKKEIRSFKLKQLLK